MRTAAGRASPRGAVFLRFLYGRPRTLFPIFTCLSRDCPHVSRIEELIDGFRMDRRHRGVVDRHGRGGARPRQARRAPGRAQVIGLDVLYGFAGLLAVILFAYLVFALLCAEEF